MSKIGVITQARMTSTRLPGKVLVEVAGRTLLEHHLDRLAWSGLPLYVATTANDADDPIVEVAHGRGLVVHRGSEHDVLARFHECAEVNGLDVVVRVTSDCPLIDGHIIADAVDRFTARDDDWIYLSNGLERTFPRGLDLEVFSAVALADAYQNATGPAQREHVTPYLYAADNRQMTREHLYWRDDAAEFRITLDTADDLAVIRRLIEDHDAHTLRCADLIALLEGHPEITTLNTHVEQKRLEERKGLA